MEDYKIRMQKEYRELKERYEKLCALLEKATEGTLDFELNCPKELLFTQAEGMLMYLNCLEERGRIENVELE